MILIPLIFIWSRAPMRYGLPTKIAILVCFALGAMMISTHCPLPCLESIAIAADRWDSESSAVSDETHSAGDASSRLREGTRLPSSLGRFSRSGRRWIFEKESVASERGLETLPAGAELATAEKPSEQAAPAVRFRVLENLALQRVADSIVQDPSDVRWAVTGVITEFDGENWLLLSTVYRAPGSAEVPGNAPGLSSAQGPSIP